MQGIVCGANTIPQYESGKRFNWTGKITDLVELIYGLAEMSCINDGKASIKELCAFFYDLFGVDGKDGYRLYADIKERKSDSRTYFLDQMAKSLNKRMDKDEELQAGKATLLCPLWPSRICSCWPQHD